MTAFERTAEYDAFGPWVMRVVDEGDVPRVFRPHGIDFDGAPLVLKVPRNVERRDADPRMHLYDRLLVLQDDGLQVLVRAGDAFVVERMAAGAIVAVDHGTDLLEGWLRVHGTDGVVVDVPHSAASAALMAEAVSRLLEMSGGGRAPGSSPVPPLDVLGDGEVGLVTAYRRTAHAWAGLRLRAAHAGSTVHEHRLVQLVRGGRLRVSGAIVAVDPEHVVVVARRRWLHRQNKPDLSERRIVLVRHRVDAVTVTPHPRVRELMEVTVRGGEAEVLLTVPTDAAAITALQEARLDRPGPPPVVAAE